MVSAEVKPLVAALVLWVVHFYWAMLRQSGTRRRLRSAFISRLKKENGGQPADLSKYGRQGSMSFMRNEPAIVNDPEFIRADRAFLNTVEQAGPLLASLALCAATVGPRAAGYTGIAYCASRALYYPLYHRPALLLALVTVPNYFAIWGTTTAAALHALLY